MAVEIEMLQQQGEEMTDAVIFGEGGSGKMRAAVWRAICANKR